MNDAATAANDEGRQVDRVADDEGSILPLTLAYALLALLMVLICANATSLYLAQKQLDGLAASAALAGADGFRFAVDGDRVEAALDDEMVRAQAQAVIDASAAPAVLSAAESPDGISARVEISARWHPPLLTLFVPDGVRLEATATSRTALH